MDNQIEALEDVYWLLDRIENMRTFNAVVDAISDLKLENINDATEQEISEVLARYSDPGVDLEVATMAIQRFYSRLYDLGINISMIYLTRRSHAPYIPIEKTSVK